MNSLHGRILEKIGADQVIYPERSMGIRVARNFTASGFEDVFELLTGVQYGKNSGSRVNGWEKSFRDQAP